MLTLYLKSQKVSAIVGSALFLPYKLQTKRPQQKQDAEDMPWRIVLGFRGERGLENERKRQIQEKWKSFLCFFLPFGFIFFFILWLVTCLWVFILSITNVVYFKTNALIFLLVEICANCLCYYMLGAIDKNHQFQKISLTNEMQ